MQASTLLLLLAPCLVLCSLQPSITFEAKSSITECTKKIGGGVAHGHLRAKRRAALESSEEERSAEIGSRSPAVKSPLASTMDVHAPAIDEEALEVYDDLNPFPRIPSDSGSSDSSQVPSRLNMLSDSSGEDGCFKCCLQHIKFV